MRNNGFAQFSVDETKVKNNSEIKQPLVTHGSVISFTMHACAKSWRSRLDGAYGQGEICNFLKSEKISKSFMSHIGKKKKIILKNKFLDIIMH